MPNKWSFARVRSGVDLVPVARMDRLIREQPDILTRVFTERELAYCAGRRQRAEHLAARFAAKEAVLKAFGTGLGQNMAWTDVEVVKDLTGRPEARLHGEIAALARRLGVQSLDISLSHTTELAIAQAVICLDTAN